MLKSRLIAGVALAALSLPLVTLSPGLPFSATAAQAQSASVSFQLFFDELQPHGVWVQHARYQYVFCPTSVDTNWRPYTHGRWLYVEGRGWYFASDEPFAWATYHYGRWFADRDLGWCWVPGTKWAPAWVSWRRSDTVVGWAPLPPEEDGYAINVVVRERDLPEAYWVFVPTEHFIEPDLSVSIVIGSQQPEYYTETQFLGPVAVEGDVVVNNVIDVTYIEQTINQQVIVYQPQEAASPAEQSVTVESQAITVFDADIAAPDAEAAPPEVVEAAAAPEAIQSAGGTAGATAEIAVEAEATVDAQPATTDAAQPAAPVEGEPGAPASDAAAPTAEPDADPAAPAEATEEAAPVHAAEQPATTEEQPAAEPLCPPETMVDGACPVTEAEQPAEQSPAPAEQAEPTTEETAPAADGTQPAAPAEAGTAEEATPAPEAALQEEPAAAPAPASGEQAAPAEEAEPAVEAAPAEEAAPAPEAQPQDQLPCPPEVRVDDKCPPAAQ